MKTDEAWMKYAESLGPYEDSEPPMTEAQMIDIFRTAEKPLFDPSAAPELKEEARRNFILLAEAFDKGGPKALRTEFNKLFPPR
jgi:hypothetical protein